MNEQKNTERSYLVTKSNQIVQKSRYDFSVAEQRTIAYICSKIKPTDSSNMPYQLEYEFSIVDYARTCGFDTGGKFYNDVKATLKSLRDKSMWLTLPDGSETTVGWLAKATTNKKSGIAKIKIDEDLAPYLFDLKNKFLSYGLKNILNMKSQYSIRLYELLKSYHDMKIGQIDRRKAAEKDIAPHETYWTVELDELKKKLMTENVKSYSNFNLFKTKVLVIAQKEINELTDIKISFEPITQGRKVVQIRFKICRKAMKERLVAEHRNDLLLDNTHKK